MGNENKKPTVTPLSLLFPQSFSDQMFHLLLVACTPDLTTSTTAHFQSDTPVSERYRMPLPASSEG